VRGKKPTPEMIVAMQLIGLERLEKNVSDNIFKDNELILAMDSIDDVFEHLQWKKSKLINEAIDRFIAARLENLDNLNNINASLENWKAKWTEYYEYLSQQDSEKMCELEEQYTETGSCPVLEQMTLPEEFDWTPVDYTNEQWQNKANENSPEA
jgi:uncharacterized protein YaaN involved in tellurite resistance